MSIGALAGIEPRDAGVASGLLNTTQQIGGAIGTAVATTIATTYAGHYAVSHSVGSLSPAALTHGFTITFYVLAGISLAGAMISALVLEPHEKLQAQVTELVPALEEAA